MKYSDIRSWFKISGVMGYWNKQFQNSYLKLKVAMFLKVNITVRNVKNTDLGFNSKCFTSIYTLPYFTLNKSVFSPCRSMFSIKHVKLIFFRKKMDFLCFLFIQHGFPCLCLVIKTDKIVFLQKTRQSVYRN